MSKRLVADRRGNLIRVNLDQGCYLLLTWAEYVAAWKGRKWKGAKQPGS